MSNRKAGPVTLALGLIIFGTILFISNISGMGVMVSALKFWPILFVALGIEFFIRSFLNRRKDESQETKFHLPTVIIILLVTLIGYAGHQVAGLFKSNDLNAVISEAVAGDRYSYQREYESKAVVVKPGVTSVKMEGPDGRVDLVPSSDGKFHVEADVTGWGPSEQEARRRAEMFKIEVKEGDLISVYGGQRMNSRRPVEVVYRLAIPKGVSVTLDNGNGQVKADNLESNLDIRLQSGEVSLRNIKGNVSYEGENGQATFEAIDGSLESRLGNGKIFVKDVSRDIRAYSDNGDIELSSSKPVSSNYSIENQNGFIVLKLPESSDAAIKAETSTGSIRGSLNLKLENNQPGPGGKAGVTLGAGKGLINLRNSSGNIVIDKY